jgi:hypothetical protein
MKLGDTLESISVPIKIKTMKKRTVKVALHKVTGLDSSGNPTAAVNIPSEAEIENELNKVYGRQVNTFFDVTLYTETDPILGGIHFDRDDNLELDVETDVLERSDATPNAKAEGENPIANIDVWVIGGVSLKVNGSEYYGYQFGGTGSGKILIDGNLMEQPRTPERHKALFLHVLCHEIGHVFTGPEHPNEGKGKCVLRWRLIGPAVSHDPRDQARLMCSGEAADEDRLGIQLIKKEWDLIDAWLKAEEQRLGRSL